MQTQEITEKVSTLMPGLLADLEELIAIPSVSFPGYPSEPMDAMAERTLQMFRDAGFDDARLMEVPSGYPPIYGEVRGPEGSPVVVIYAHYDVQPAPPEQGWTTEPFTPTRKDDGRIYGRGSADDISGLVAHLGTMRVFDGRPPCTVKLILEGMEETESNLEAFVEAHPELFECDLFVICDMGNLRGRGAGPHHRTARRRRVRRHRAHARPPPALRSLRRARARRDDGARPAPVHPARRPGQRRRRGRLARLSGTARTSAPRTSAPARTCSTAWHLTGTGRVGDLLWAQPSVNAIGIDMTPIATSSNVLIPQASAKISMRIVPGSEPKDELDALVAHLEKHTPWGAQVEVRRTKEAPPFQCATDGPGYAAARAALSDAFGRPAGEAGCGGSIPLLRTLQQASPGAEFVLWGPEDVAGARIHASDESVDPSEIEKLVVAQALLLQRLADGTA